MIRFLFLALALIPLSLSAKSIYGVLGGDTLKLTACTNEGGAICSLTWRGTEFVDRHDLGRHFQFAFRYDSINGEAINPTEAGNRKKQASNLLFISNRYNELTTTSQMAYFLSPDECSPSGNCPVNESVLSNTVMQKWVSVGVENIPYAIKFKVRYTLEDINHLNADYQPVKAAISSRSGASFNQVYTYNRVSGELERWQGGVNAGELNRNSDDVFIVSNGRWAWGIYAPNVTFYSVKRSPTAGSSIPNESGIIGVAAMFHYESEAYAIHEHEAYYIIGSIHNISSTIGRVIAKVER